MLPCNPLKVLRESHLISPECLHQQKPGPVNRQVADDEWLAKGYGEPRIVLSKGSICFEDMSKLLGFV